MAIETKTIPSKAKSSLKSSVKHFVNSNLTTTYTKYPLFWDLTVQCVTVSSYFLLFFSNCSYLSFVNCFLKKGTELQQYGLVSRAIDSNNCLNPEKIVKSNLRVRTMQIVIIKFLSQQGILFRVNIPVMSFRNWTRI